jgi:hypothetical protein
MFALCLHPLSLRFCDAQSVASTRPPRSIAFSAIVNAEAPAAELFALALDLERLREMDPRLREASWASPGPTVGALAKVRTDVAFMHAWVGRMIGEQRGTVRLLELAPGRRIGYLCEHSRGEAYLRVGFDGSGDRCTLDCSGWIRASGIRAQNATRVLRPLIAILIERSLRRSTARACRYLHLQPASLVALPS